MCLITKHKTKKQQSSFLSICFSASNISYIHIKTKGGFQNSRDRILNDRTVFIYIYTHTHTHTQTVKHGFIRAGRTTKNN